MLGESGILECRYRDCHPEEVMIEGVCRHVDDTSMCEGSGREGSFFSNYLKTKDMEL